MEVEKTDLQDCLVIRHNVFEDDRGFFFESFNKNKFKSATGIDFDVKQVNFAKSHKGVLRGLHYQLHPHSQAKLVGVLNGAVLDIAVDLRRDSPSFGQAFSILIEDQRTNIYVPRGFAHGYEVLEDDTIFYYAVDNYYAPASERGIRYDDPFLKLNWKNKNNQISEKDQVHPFLKDAELNFSISEIEDFK